MRIGWLAIVAVAAVTALVLGVMSGLILRAHSAALLAQLTRSADQLSETISRSTYVDMLENRRDALHREISTIGTQEGIEKVRLFNATGTIMFSSDPAEIGRSVDKRGEACYACHEADRPLQRLTTRERSRIYRGAGGHRVLGMIRPISNDVSCWSAACHAHQQQDAVLGVLDVNLSMADADRQIARDQRRLWLLLVLAIATTSLLLWWLGDRLIWRPVAALIAGTRRVAEGDLHTTIPATARHELGDLARAFNDMTRRLGEAQRQLTQADKLASIGRLAAGVAHELNNPLTGVLTYASFLEKRAHGDPEVQHDLEVIVRETKRCRDIVRGLLDFSRQTPPRRQPADLNEVVRHGVAIVMNQLAIDRVELKLELEADLPPIPADANQIQQVVVNLLVNAADAVGERGGAIHLATHAVTVPARGHAAIRQAACPRGCDLLDPGVRIGGLSSIRVIRRVGDRDTTVHLDPVYGRANHRLSDGAGTGLPATYLCPLCRSRLDDPGRRCGECGRPTFAVSTGAAGPIEWCTRRDCHWTRWEAVERGGPQRFAELVVEDTGRGIPREHLDRLFEPFFTTKGGRGSGLGLAVTWRIVESHEGTIDVDSELDRGTRFTVRLPYAAGPTPPAPAGPPAPASMPAAVPAGARGAP
jgi:two-component system NtrC family sensor kinase